MYVILYFLVKIGNSPLRHGVYSSGIFSIINITLFTILLLKIYSYYVILGKGRVPTPKWMLPNGFLSLWTPPILGSDRIGIFYFLWFLTLMRKARNVIIKLPKVTNSVRIPMNIEIISKAVIITHPLPMYS